MNRNGPHMDPLIYLLVRCPSYSIQFSVIHIYTWVVCTCVCQYVQIQVFQHSQLKTLFCVTQVNFTLVMVSLCTSGIFPCYFQAIFSCKWLSLYNHLISSFSHHNHCIYLPDNCSHLVNDFF